MKLFPMTFLCLILLALPVFGETEHVELLRSFPPKGNFVTREDYLFGISQLRWQQTQADALRDILTIQLKEIEVNEHRFDQESEELRESLLFSDAEIGATLTSRCLEELLSIKLEIATTTQMLKTTEEHSVQRRAIEQDRKSMLEKKRGQYLQQRRELLEQELKRKKELARQNVVPQSEVRKIQTELATLELGQVERQLQLEAHNTNAPNYDDQVANLRIQLASLTARDKAVREFLADVTSTSKNGRQLRRLVRAREELAVRKQRLMERLDEIELSRAETSSFLTLIEDHLEESKKKSKLPEEQSSAKDDE